MSSLEQDEVIGVQQYVPILLTFVLSTLIGGIFGAVIQQRAWRHRWQVERAERLYSEAMKTFDEVSTLMDRRLFRLTQLRTWTSRDDEEMFKSSLDSYREALAEWNNSINRILARLQIYLGQDIRETFDYFVGAKFVKIGSEIEQLVRGRSGGLDLHFSEIDTRIPDLRAEVYKFNIDMLSKIENREEPTGELGFIQEMKYLFMPKQAFVTRLEAKRQEAAPSSRQ